MIKIIAYADDIVLIFEEKDYNTIESLLKSLKVYGLEVNYEKSGLMSHKKNIPDFLQPFPVVKEYKYLGLPFSTSMTRILKGIKSTMKS